MDYSINVVVLLSLCAVYIPIEFLMTTIFNLKHDLHGDGDPHRVQNPRGDRGWGENVPRNHSRGRGRGENASAGTGMVE